jgi:hypothetical protein
VSLRGTTEERLPYVVEAALARTAVESEHRVLITGCNFSPALVKPIIRNLDWMLERQHISHNSPVMVLFHVATPNPIDLDRGKSVVSVTGQLKEDCEKCITTVAAEYC